MMRDCPDGEMRDLLPLLATSRLSHAVRARVEAHVAGCAACARELELLRAVGRAFDVAPLDAARIAQALPGRRRSAGVRPFHSQPLWRIAASLTLMIAGTAGVMVVRQRAARAPVVQVAMGDTGVATSPNGARGVSGASAAGGTDVAQGQLGFGVSLSDLTDAQLETLLGSLDGIEANVSPDPERMSKPIVPAPDDNSKRN